MSGLPSGWASALIGELIELNPKNFTDDNTTIGFVPMPLMATNILEPVRFAERPWHEVKRGYTHFADGDVLLAKITPCFENGKAGVAENLPNGLGAGSTEFYVCRPSPGVVLAKYLLASFKTADFLREGEMSMTGAVGQQRVPKAFLLKHEIPLAPLAEQTRIADKLDALLARVDAARERLDRIPHILKRFRQSVLAAATSGDLTEDWREGRAVEWASVFVRDVGHARLGKMLDKSKNTGKETLYLRNINVRWFGFDLSDVGEIRVSDEERVELSIADGDVLICEGGEPGRCATWRNGENDFVFQKALHRVRLGDTCLPEWLCYCLKVDADSNALSEFFTGTTIKHLTGAALDRWQFPLPPKAEQSEIIRRVESLFALADAVQAKYTAARARVDKLTPALLAKAFRGELVPQDPNDEPAEKLLARLREANQGAARPVKRGRKPTTA